MWYRILAVIARHARGSLGFMYMYTMCDDYGMLTEKEEQVGPYRMGGGGSMRGGSYPNAGSSEPSNTVPPPTLPLLPGVPPEYGVPTIYMLRPPFSGEPPPREFKARLYILPRRNVSHLPKSVERYPMPWDPPLGWTRRDRNKPIQHAEGEERQEQRYTTRVKGVGANAKTVGAHGFLRD